MSLHISLHVLLVLWWLCGGLRSLARVGLEPVSCLFFMSILCFSLGAVAVLLSQRKNRLQFGSCRYFFAGRQTSSLWVKTPQWIPLKEKHSGFDST